MMNVIDSECNVCSKDTTVIDKLILGY